MQTADTASSLPDFVTDGPHLIFRELNKNEADKKKKLNKQRLEQMDLCFSTTLIGF